MLKGKGWVFCVMPLVLLTAVGCGKQSLSPSPNGNTVANAVKQFNQQEQSEIHKINQDFVQESNLFKEVSTKQISYNSFKSSYGTIQSQVNAEIGSISSATAPAGAETYKKEYIALLNQGLKVFSDQEKAILPDRSIDKKSVSTLQQELIQFESDSKQLAAKYGVS